MAAFWCYFRDFVAAQKIEDLTESKMFFAELFQIISRFALAKKKIGVRCTLKLKRNIRPETGGYFNYILTPCMINQMIRYK